MALFVLVMLFFFFVYTVQKLILTNYSNNNGFKKFQTLIPKQLISHIENYKRKEWSMKYVRKKMLKQ